MSELDGLRLSFGEPLRFLVSPVTGRVHPRYQIAGAPTGRSSTSKPNIQGAPRDPRIRGVFQSRRRLRARRGRLQLHGAARRRLLFRRSAIGRRVRARRRSAQIDREPCRRAGPPDTITDEERSKAKNVNFGTIYGIGPASLVEQIWKNYRLVISLADAENLLAGFASLYPMMIAHRRDYASVCQARGRIIIGPDWREGQGPDRPARPPAERSIDDDVRLFVSNSRHLRRHLHEGADRGRSAPAR